MVSILPLSQLTENGIQVTDLKRSIEDRGSHEIKDIIGDYRLFKMGRDAITAVINYLQLKRDDEVYITTTTDTSYVSTCVSATIFNICKISRVLTDKTKAIFVIHNFGFPHPDLLALRELADDRKIPLIEDCVFAFDSFTQTGIRLGSIGDFSIYSLYKIVPITYGGILAFKKRAAISGINDRYLETELADWTPKLWYIKKKRQAHYNFLYSRIPNSIYGPLADENPFMYGFYHENEADFLTEPGVEFGKTHVKKEVHIPVNAFLNQDDLQKFCDYVG
jgi:hypothetical protein